MSLRTEGLGVLDRFGEQRYETLCETAAQGPPDGVSGALLAAMGWRESSLTNITGDGGHGRGCLQIDDRSHTAWLKTHAGCPSGSWKVRWGPHSGGALPAGRCPTLTAAATYAVTLLRNAMIYARSQGVSERDGLRFAIAAYNCGAGNAIKAYHQGNVDMYTANGNYSGDVLARKRTVLGIVNDRRW